MYAPGCAHAQERCAKVPSGGGGQPVHIGDGGNSQQSSEWPGGWICVQDPSGNVSLHPDGKRFAASLRTVKRDIWILERSTRRGGGPAAWLR